MDGAGSEGVRSRYLLGVAEKEDKMFNWLKKTEVWKSIFRHGTPDNEKDQALIMTAHFFTHIHPVKVKRHGLNFTYTFGLGGMSLALYMILAVTGFLLMFYYVPSTDRAYQDMLTLRNDLAYGWFIRNMHRWGAHFMVAIVYLHMIRVFLTASYKGPRKFNWVIGVFLFIFTTLLSYTGYLLPWDQLAYWGVNVGTQLAKYTPPKEVGDQLYYMLLGAKSIGQNALIRFYTLHVFVLPFIMIFLMAIHFYRVRRDGGISGPIDP